jgi:exodeoxyribonuclease VII small subunit
LRRRIEMSDSDISYERAVELFDEKLKALEEGNLSLEDALAAVEQASGYLRAANQRLEEARKKIEVRPLEGASAGAADARAQAPDNGGVLPLEDGVPF